MSEFIFAIIGLIIGGAVGGLVMSMCHVSKRADEDAKKAFEAYDFAKGINMTGHKVSIRLRICGECKGVHSISDDFESRSCPYCGSIGGGAHNVNVQDNLTQAICSGCGRVIAWNATEKGYRCECCESISEGDGI